jgi:hypothetical protein
VARTHVLVIDHWNLAAVQDHERHSLLYPLSETPADVVRLEPRGRHHV